MIKLLNLLFLILIAGCGGGQSAPGASDSSVEELAIISDPVEISTFDFKNHDMTYQSLDFLSEMISEHQQFYLKLSPRSEPGESLFFGRIDSDTSLNQLRLHLPSEIKSVEYHLFNATGFIQSGTINF